MDPRHLKSGSPVQTHHLALDAAQVDHAEVAGQDGLERGKGLQRRDAPSLGDYWQRQDLVVQEGAGHVTENGGEAGRCGVNHLWGGWAETDFTNSQP